MIVASEIYLILLRVTWICTDLVNWHTLSSRKSRSEEKKCKNTINETLEEYLMVEYDIHIYICDGRFEEDCMHG